MQPDVIGMNCATGPGRDDRAPALPRAARAHVPLGAAQRGTAVGRRRAHALRPHARRARRGARALRRTSSASTSSAAAAARRPSTSRAVVDAARRRPRAGRAHARARAGLLVDLLARAVPPGARVPRRRRAHERERLAEVPRRDARSRLRHVRRDGARAGEGRRARARRVRRLRRPRRHARHGRDRGPVRDAGVAAARVRLDRAAGASKPGCSTTAARRSSTRPTSKRARARASAWTACSASPANTARRSSASRSTKRARRAPPSGSCASRKRIYDIAIERYGLEPTDLIFDALTFPLSTGDDDLRRDAMETIEAIRRIKAELPGASTILGLSNVSFGLKPAARHVLNSVFLHECREAGLDAAIVHAARIVPLQPHRRAPARGRARPDLRPPPRRLRPAHRVHGAVRGRRSRRDREGRPLGLAGRRSGCRTASSTATATASKPTSRRRSRRCRRSRSSTTCCSTA